MKQQVQQNGFTLLETIIAIGIILFGLLSILALSTSSLVVSNVTSDEFLATNFAREGMEIVRSVRDSNWLAYDTDSTTVWDNQLFGTGLDYTSIVGIRAYLATGEYLQYLPDTFGDTCTGSGGVLYDCTAIWYDPASQLYFQTALSGFVPASFEQTNFSRLVYTNPICRLDSDETVETVITTGSCAVGSTHVGVDVVVQVQWPGRNNVTSTYSLEEYLYDWKY